MFETQHRKTDMAENVTLDSLIAKIKDKDEKIRAEGWQNAEAAGASAVKPLAALTISGDVNLETSRAAKLALWRIVRRVPDSSRAAVLTELLALLEDAWPDAFRRDVLWMLSEIGDDSCVPALADLLKSGDLVEDSRCALQRIPGDASLKALKTALESATKERQKLRIAQSLRERGVDLSYEIYPDEKLTPAKPYEPRSSEKK